jgi:hypothetical protein
MIITITRRWYTDNTTIGELDIPAEATATGDLPNYNCFTLEDAVRMFKIFGKTAIPAGKYRIAIVFEETKFKRYRIMLEKVPNFTNIYQHKGNNEADTNGCVLVGEKRLVDFVENSALADAKIWERVIMHILKNPWDAIYFEVKDTQPPKVF